MLDSSHTPSSCLNATVPHAGGQAALPFSLFTTQSGQSSKTQLEQFIRSGFAHAYGAVLNEFMPFLIGLGNTQPGAALGVRFARRPLFIENYHSLPVEALLSHHGLDYRRDEVAEIGNLFSRQRIYTRPLLLLTGLALLELDTKVIVFCATSQLRKMFSQLDLKLHYLCDANSQSLGDKAACWGSYYATHPQVVALELELVPRLIASTPALYNLFQTLTPLIALASHNMESFR